MADLIKYAKTALPCRNVDTQVIWDTFRAINRARGDEQVPAGYLLGFMRRLRSAGAPSTPQPKLGANEEKAAALMRFANVKNWRFHERDLEWRIGSEAYVERFSLMQARLGLNRFFGGFGGAWRGRRARRTSHLTGCDHTPVSTTLIPESGSSSS